MDVLGRAAQLREQGKPFALATVTWRRVPSSGKPGSKAIIHPDGTVEGWMGGACAQPTVVRNALEALVDGRPRTLVLGESDAREGVLNVSMACSSEGAMEVFVEPIAVTQHLHVVGSSPMTDLLKRLAGELGWRVSGTDEPEMPGVLSGSYVVVATQGHYDEPALQAALAGNAAYVGLVASEKRAATVREWLSSRGVTDEQLARLRAPAGLDLGHVSHEEIAVAILAELVAMRAMVPMGQTEVQMPEEAIDPVCGMTVDVASARWSSEHDGATIYFCAPGCQKAYDADPSAFAS